MKDTSSRHLPLLEETYVRTIQVFHWAMAAGFVFKWFSGVFVTNIYGVAVWIEDGRQAAMRDLHKSAGLSLLALVIIRFSLRLVYRPPALPAAIGASEHRSKCWRILGTSPHTQQLSQRL